MITKIQPIEYSVLTEIWSASVQATHGFLAKEDFDFFHSQMPLYYAAVQLFAFRSDDGKILGFIGLSEDEIEMLFIHPHSMGQGFGKKLVEYAIKECSVTKVTVNEQNTGALEFYQKMGFRIESRSELDGFGKPYPILLMSI